MSQESQEIPIEFRCGCGEFALEVSHPERVDELEVTCPQCYNQFGWKKDTVAKACRCVDHIDVKLDQLRRRLTDCDDQLHEPIREHAQYVLDDLETDMIRLSMKTDTIRQTRRLLRRLSNVFFRLLGTVDNCHEIEHRVDQVLEAIDRDTGYSEPLSNRENN